MSPIIFLNGGDIMEWQKFPATREDYYSMLDFVMEEAEKSGVSDKQHPPRLAIQGFDALWFIDRVFLVDVSPTVMSFQRRLPRTANRERSSQYEYKSE